MQVFGGPELPHEVHRRIVLLGVFLFLRFYYELCKVVACRRKHEAKSIGYIVTDYDAFILVTERGCP